jgi:hypothetical protein
VAASLLSPRQRPKTPVCGQCGAGLLTSYIQALAKLTVRGILGRGELTRVGANCSVRSALRRYNHPETLFYPRSVVFWADALPRSLRNQERWLGQFIVSMIRVCPRAADSVPTAAVYCWLGRLVNWLLWVRNPKT